MKNKKMTVSMFVAVITLGVLVIGATYAYFTVATTNSFGTKTATATTESVGSVILKTGTNLSLTVTRVQMLQSNVGKTYYAVGSTTNAGVLGTAEVLGEGNYSCTYTLNVALSGTMLDSVTSKGSTILYINDTAYDIYDYKTSKSITIDGSLIGISEDVSRNITGNIAIINKNSSQNSELAGKTVTASITASNFKCTAGDDITMLSGDEQVWNETSGDTLSFTSSAQYSDFEEVRINQEIVDPSNYTYTTESGSTVVTLKKEYIKSLPSGNHEIIIVSKTGGASASFAVGEQNGPVLLNQKIMSLVGDTVGDGTVINANGYRYSGSNPNNYITFNNETWRIIGIVDGYVKIIRNDSIGEFSWDYKTEGVGSSTIKWGSNNWSDSQLMMMLNPVEYLKEGYTINNNMVYDPSGNLLYQNMGSYYNRTSGYRPASISVGASSYTGNSVDFSSIGLTLASRNVVQENVWYLSAVDTDLTPDMHYEYERNGQIIYLDRPITWRGKVGLMYMSDYYYANNSLYNNPETYYSSNTFCEDNWLCLTDAELPEWTLTQVNSQTRDVIFAYDGEVIADYADAVENEFGVRPAVYLKPGIKVTGDGTINSKYQIVS